MYITNIGVDVKVTFYAKKVKKISIFSLFSSRLSNKCFFFIDLDERRAGNGNHSVY